MRSRPRDRVLIAAWGSAGDVFPLVPVIRSLMSQGYDVRCAMPRSMGLFIRTQGVPAHGLGRGRELRIFDDERTVTARFGGWASWRSLVTRYVGPTLRDDVEGLLRMFQEWRPDVVVCGSFSPAGRVAAHLSGIPRVEATIYPQQRGRLGRPRSFARGLRDAVASLCADRGTPAGDGVVSDLAWGGLGGGVVLHDRSVLGDDGGSPEVVGFPYWDEGPQRSADAELVDGWLDESSGPVVAVTLGSFLGVRQQAVWVEAAKAVAALGVRAVFMGTRRRWADEVFEGRTDLLTVGFVPLSRIAGRVDAVVHHGGIGTMFGALRAGCPAVVLPQAFDQPFNARLVEQVGAGVDGSAGSLADALRDVLVRTSYRDAARAVAAELVPTETATERVVACVRERLPERAES